MQRTSIIVSLLIAFSLILGACAPAAPATQPANAAQQPTETSAAQATATSAPQMGKATLPEIDPGEVTGNIITAGSSTVYPLTEAIVNLFLEEGYTGQITVDSIGTGGGFERFCKTGETDISNASRQIKSSEIDSCKAISRDPIEFRVGTDAMAVVVNPSNDFVTNLSAAELAMIFSDQVEKWSEVNPSWPAEPIKRYAPGTDSGTYDFFIEVVMQPAYEKDATKAKTAFQSAMNLQASEDDNVLVQGVEGDRYAIGFFGFAYYQENQDRMKVVSIDGITPTLDSAEDGSYLLSRPLFIYSDATILKEKPQVAQFISFYLSRVNEVIGEVGYFPASADALDQAKQALLDAMK